MARQKQLRKIPAPPKFSGFRPYGCLNDCKGSVDLLYEEYEAIRLADYDRLNYESAAVLMGISRATFARIYESAREKIAKALVEGKEIISVFGNVHLDSEWFFCNDCHARFDIQTNTDYNYCPVCRSENIYSLNGQSR